jgi:CRISPR type III-B/RAMP module-associated protein Cmr3
MRGPWFVRGDSEVLIPAPADLGVVLNPLADRATSGGRPRYEEILQVVRYRHPPYRDGSRWSHPLDLASPFYRVEDQWLPWQAEPGSPEPETAAEWYLDEAGALAWMGGATPATTDFVHRSELWYDEVRTGLGMQDTSRLAAEHMLYTFGYIRLAPGTSLGFEVRATGLSAGGHLRLGGDGKMAELLSGPPFPHTSAPKLEGTAFSLTFLTPCPSTAGAYPPGFASDRLTARLARHEATLTGAVVRAPALVGGWSLATGGPRTLRRSIPAGAVYTFRAKDAHEIASAIHVKNLSDYPNDHLAQQGFGFALTGAST